MQARSPDCNRQTFGIYKKKKKKKKNNSMHTAKQQMFSPCSLSVVGRLQPLPLPHTRAKMSGWRRILSEPRVTVAPTLTLMTLGHGRNISDWLVSCEGHQATASPFCRVAPSVGGANGGVTVCEVSQVSGGSSAIPVDYEQRFSHHRSLNIYMKGLRQRQKKAISRSRIEKLKGSSVSLWRLVELNQ